MGCHACSGMASIAARTLRSWRMIENRTPNLRAMLRRAGEQNAESTRIVSGPDAAASRRRDTSGVGNDLAPRAAPQSLHKTGAVQPVNDHCRRIALYSGIAGPLVARCTVVSYARRPFVRSPVDVAEDDANAESGGFW